MRQGGCGDGCPVNTPGTRCSEHGCTWDHCPHGRAPGDCYHGSPAGQGHLRGRNGHHGGGDVYATREAAEEYLYRWEREQERRQREQEPEIKRLRREMADAHPDRGGTDEGFIAARERYQQALREAS